MKTQIKFVVFLNISHEDKEIAYDLLNKAGLQSENSHDKIVTAVEEFELAKKVLQKNTIAYELALVKIQVQIIEDSLAPGERQVIPLGAVEIEVDQFSPKKRQKKNKKVNSKDPELDVRKYNLPPNTPDWIK